MNNEPSNRPKSEPSMSGTEALLFVHGELVRIEHHLTDQVKAQSDRISSLPAVNGFLLAFLAAGGLQITSKTHLGWYVYPYYATLTLLCLGLIFWGLTLFPRIMIAGPKPLRDWFLSTFGPPTGSSFYSQPALWLDSQRVWDLYRRVPDTDQLDDFLRQLCESAAANANGGLDHIHTVLRRRQLMNLQIAAILISLVLLIVAVSGWAIAAR